MPDLSRRQFVASIAGVACSVSVRGVVLAGPTSRPGSSDEPRGFSAGPIANIPRGATGTFASKDVILVRTTMPVPSPSVPPDVPSDIPSGAPQRSNKEIIYALSSACTHQGGVIAVKNGALKCTRHAGAFDLAGKAIHGPATGQLARHGVTVRNGNLWVDPYKIFLPGDFDRDGAFVKVS